MNDRTEAPSVARLESLRRRGIVPYSALATRAVATAALILVLITQAPKVSTLFSELMSTLSDALSQPIEKFVLTPLLDQFVLLLVSPALAVLITTIAVGLLQTRGLFRFSAMVPFRTRARGEGVPHRLGACLSLVLSIGVAFLGAFLTFKNLAPPMLGQMNADLPELCRWLIQGAEIVPVLSLVLVLGGFGAAMTSRYLFNRRYRMSRRELESESYDDEG